ncbi:IclR family transcriptional regulator [Peribacillus cavernae]|uniref:Glycerol operon regulatory protein n=1 Tax=Peribacillus cavernae TaxID=1674310 RepID=A0A3S0VIL8_9BACI|nr:IclR family transcriptional regulator [Peribacillus cavernae]MDQ0218019.1 DNA-binding IclR family transcriptional regulator [Peribacillus cavernae]RUQ32815.1 IclR family transcriptional regulator [Peribacillus cavernae]
MKTEQENLLSSVNNALKVLRSFKMEQPQKGVRELADELGLGKSSVQRILATLAADGFVKKNKETNKYELGVSVLELSSIVLGHLDLHNEALPIIKSLVEKWTETSHLSVLEDLQVVYLCKMESANSIKLTTHLGLHNPLHCTSSGKLLLAYSDPSLLELILKKGLDKYTHTTITDPALFRKELAKIYEKGYSVSYEELRMGVISVSAPIRDHTGKVIAAINFVGPSHRFSKQRINLFAKELIHAGEVISERLGYWIK